MKFRSFCSAWYNLETEKVISMVLQDALGIEYQDPRLICLNQLPENGINVNNVPRILTYGDHRWELPVFHYHSVRVYYAYPFLGAIFWVNLHNFIRQNYQKTVISLPFFLVMVNYPIFHYITTFYIF